ncbi:MAG: hypothetical protein AAF518_15850 [Spirochaetota bacterium]
MRILLYATVFLSVFACVYLMVRLLERFFPKKEKVISVSAFVLLLVVEIFLLGFVVPTLFSDFQQGVSLSCFPIQCKYLQIEGKYRSGSGKTTYRRPYYWLYDYQTGKKLYEFKDPKKLYRGIFQEHLVFRKKKHYILKKVTNTKEQYQEKRLYTFILKQLSLPEQKIHRINFTKNASTIGFSIITKQADSYTLVENRFPKIYINRNGVGPWRFVSLSPLKKKLSYKKRLLDNTYLNAKIIAFNQEHLILLHNKELDNRQSFVITMIDKQGERQWQHSAKTLGLKFIGKQNAMQDYLNHELVLAIVGRGQDTSKLDSWFSNQYLYIYKIAMETGKILWRKRESGSDW